MKIVLFGKNGQLGKAVIEKLSYGNNLIAVGREEVNLENPISLANFLQYHKPKSIINCAAFTSVDLAETKPELVDRINAQAVKIMAQEAKKNGSVLVHFSTDYVFNGEKNGYYLETDPVSPVNVYGNSKADAEEYIRQVACRHIILRTGWLYGKGKANFPKRLIERINQGQKCEIVSDCFGAPTCTSDLADALGKMLKKIFSKSAPNIELLGTYHLTASGYTSWFKYALIISDLASRLKIINEKNEIKIYPIKMEELNLAAQRPKNCRLNCDKAKKNFDIEMPNWEESFVNYLTREGIHA